MWIESYPGRRLREAWLYLTPDEGRELLAALSEPPAAEWQTHVTDADRQLTVAISLDVGTAAFSRRFHP